MSVIPIDQPPDAGDAVTKHESLWQRLGEALDAYLAAQSRRAVPLITLRRSKHDIERCRRLMHKGSAMAATAGSGSRGSPGHERGHD